MKCFLNFQDIDDRHPENGEDSFARSLNNVNVSFPSNSSGSYVTAFCESDGSNEMIRIMTPAVTASKNVVDKKFRRKGSFDADSGKGVSPPPPQHVPPLCRSIIDIPDLEIHNGHFCFLNFLTFYGDFYFFSST